MLLAEDAGDAVLFKLCPAIPDVSFNGVSVDQLSISSYDSISEASQLTSFPWFSVQQVFNMLKRVCIPIESLIPNIQLLPKKTPGKDLTIFFLTYSFNAEGQWISTLLSIYTVSNRR